MKSISYVCRKMSFEVTETLFSSDFSFYQLGHHSCPLEEIISYVFLPMYFSEIPLKLKEKFS